MNSSIDADLPTAALQAGRAKGALFLSFFGTAWLMLWCRSTFEHRLLPLLLVLAAGAVPMGVAFVRLRRGAPAAAAAATSTAARKTSRLFGLVNLAQWVAIVVVANLLAAWHRAEWIVPAVLLIVGLHFFPLARAFANRAHLVTGGALVVLALAYPWLAPGGPADPVGCLGAGIILWASACRTLSARAA